MTPIQLSTQQQEARGAIRESLKRHRSFKLGGFAGTGKTTLLKYVIEDLSELGRCAVMAPTGRAANVLCNKGVNATTIHRYLYELINDHPIEFRLKDTVEAAFFIIDESSMLSTPIMADLLSFQKPILFVGDPAQLEPVGDDAKAMHKPDFVLTQIHRTMEDSDIIKFATRLRSSGAHPSTLQREFEQSLPHNANSNLSFRASNTIKRSEWLNFDQIIVGTNKTRARFNQTFKKSLEALPVADDKLICLKNDYTCGVFNGEIFIVTPDKDGDIYGQDSDTGFNIIHLRAEDGSVNWYPFWEEYFFDQSLNPLYKSKGQVWFDYAYAITCHKSQGSEWDNVAVVDEAFGNPPNRWRYTAATRAAKNLTWIR